MEQVTDYDFDSSAIEVVVLAVVRLTVLLAVLLRSRASLVRVNGDGTISPSVEAMVALVLCAASAAYCVFKVCVGRGGGGDLGCRVGFA